MALPRSLLVLPALLFGACASSPPVAAPGPAASAASAAAEVDVPAAIAVPSGARFVTTLRGTGLQNYECRAKADAAGGYDWVFVAPEAVLKDKGGTLIGRHYAGPTWEHGDGSKVTGKAVANAAAPQAGNIPWLLLQTTAAPTPGAFAAVAYVQRTRTEGGIAPSDPCSASTIGTRKSVRYAADYRFFER